MKSAILVVLDGFGIAPPGPGNAIHLANPANITSYFHTFPNTTLRASGEAVGLPPSEVGNTEVGHINLGAGRIIYQAHPRINMSIADGSFYENPALLKASQHIKSTGGKLHIIGLVGQGTVHSAMDHLFALLFFAKEQQLPQVCIHAITDGRDSPPKSALALLQQLEEKIKNNPSCHIATVMGRYYAMDRDRRWERIEKAYRCLTLGEGLHAGSVEEAVNAAYQNNKTDEFIDPTLIVKPDEEPQLIKEGDSVIFFNFRIDRPRELTRAFVLDDFEQQANTPGSYDPYEVKYHHKHLYQDQQTPTTTFHRGEKIKNLVFITMTEYEKKLPVEIAFPQIIVNQPLGRILSDNGIEQLRMSESEKERFVTFYFNGYRDLAFPLETRNITPSPKVATYDLKPEMSAYEQTAKLVQEIASSKYRFILINFANPDMVGHTGNIEATIKAIQAIDICIGKIVAVALQNDTGVFITADHGNAEQKINPKTGQISTEHTDSPVPFLAIAKELQGKNMKLQTGILADVAPTILAQLNIAKPSDMTGRNLLEEIRL